MNLVRRNQRLHNPESPLLIGDVKDCDVVKEINEPSYIETYEKVVPLTCTFQSICYKIYWMLLFNVLEKCSREL